MTSPIGRRSIRFAQRGPAVSSAIDARLEEITAEELSAPSERGFPGVERTRLGVLTFLVQHDSYHVGQLALLRKPAGLPAMSYR